MARPIGATKRALPGPFDPVSRPGANPARGPRKLGSGGRIRTCDLRVMSPTSCQTAPPRISKGGNNNDSIGEYQGPLRPGERYRQNTEIHPISVIRFNLDSYRDVRTRSGSKSKTALFDLRLRIAAGCPISHKHAAHGCANARFSAGERSKTTLLRSVMQTAQGWAVLLLDGPSCSFMKPRSWPCKCRSTSWRTRRAPASGCR